MEQKIKNKAKILNCDFEKCLEKLQNEIFDIIYIDPPYKTNYIEKSLKQIIESKIASEDSLIILETDEEERIIKEIENIKVEIIDKRKYGRATVIFVKKKNQ